MDVVVSNVDVEWCQMVNCVFFCLFVGKVVQQMLMYYVVDCVIGVYVDGFVGLFKCIIYMVECIYQFVFIYFIIQMFVVQCGNCQQKRELVYWQ